MATAVLPGFDDRSTAGPLPRVIVIGGGMAGMAAAVALESAGLAVTLLEARRFLGGRASSFDDSESAEQLDTGQHVLLGCCTNLRDFLRRLNASQLICYERSVHFRDAGGQRHDIWGMPGLAAPLHLGPALAAFSSLSMRDRLGIGRAMFAMLRLGRHGREQLADISFGQWLAEHGQSASATEQFYNPVLIGALNELPTRASAAYAIQVFQDAMLAHETGYLVGLPSCPLVRLYDHLPCRDVRRGTRVVEMCFVEGVLRAVKLYTGEMLAADAFVLATSRHAVSRLLPAEVRRSDSRLVHLEQFEDVPILSAQLWFDRPVMAEMHTALLAGPLQWLFRKDHQGCVLHGVISAARAWVGQAKEQCLQAFERQIRAAFPEARSARLERGRILIDKRATFSPRPGIDRYRPAQSPPAGGISNLFLAGDYTQTHWPATMEGAVRSGYLAADAVLHRVLAGGAGRGSFLADDLPIRWPARLLGYRD